MLERMEKEISEDIKKAYSSGKVNTQKLKEIVENAVSKLHETTEVAVSEIGEVSKKAVTTAVEELKLVNDATKENIDAVVLGTVDGVKKNLKKSIDTLDMELLKTKYRVQEQRDILASHLKDGFNGVKESASSFSDEIKTDIENSVTNLKLKSVETLGLMQETINQSVKSIIAEGEDIEEKVAHIAKEATKNALESTRLSAQKTKEVSQAVILEAINAAQESGKDVKEVTLGAINGVK